MSYLDHSGCNKRKRVERVFKFKTFGKSGHPVIWDNKDGESFLGNMKSLVEFGHVENDLFCGRVSWSFQLELNRHPSVHVFLFVVEEPVELYVPRQCKYCQYVGWGHNLICNKKYHFLMCSKDSAVACLSDKVNCQRGTTMKGRPSLVELKGQIMHGVFHSNGFGHLLCVNGLETGSCLPGYQIMDFWDRLCNGLRARKVSLNDSATKKNMDLRLFHGVAYGEPWFGRWGYKFGRGSFGVTQQMYQKAVEALHSMPLSLISHHLQNLISEIPLILSRYQTLSSYSLMTLGDLFHFMLELKSRLPKDTLMNSYNSGILTETKCRWSPKRVEMAIRVIVEALKRVELRWISRQEVRDSARSYIGDTGLLDFVLKSLGNHIVGNYLVRRSLNPVTKVLEYCLEDVSNTFLSQEGHNLGESKMKARYMITRVQLMKDLFYMYTHILKSNKSTIAGGIFANVPFASMIVLDSKYLIKEYCGELPVRVDVSTDMKSIIYCTISLRNENIFAEGLSNVIAPYESFKLNNVLTFDQLKSQVEKSFRDRYWGLRSFVIESIPNSSAQGTDLVFDKVDRGGKIVFQGKIMDISNENIFEGLLAKCSVDCLCGAKEEDGERMVSCDICEIMQHTRCVRIPNNEEVPSIFLCSRCEHEIVSFPCLPSYGDLQTI